MIVILYYLSNRSRDKLNTVKAQFDKKSKLTKTTKQYCEEILNDLLEYLEHNKQGCEVIIASDMNKVINSKNINKFLLSNRLFNIHGWINRANS